MSLLFLCAYSAWGYDFSAVNKGKTIFYNITNATDRICEVTGYDVTDSQGSSFNSVAYKGIVEIPTSVTYNGVTYTVTSIGNFAFYWCNELTKVTIPNSVTSIGTCVFRQLIQW